MTKLQNSSLSPNAEFLENNEDKYDEKHDQDETGENSNSNSMDTFHNHYKIGCWNKASPKLRSLLGLKNYTLTKIPTNYIKHKKVQNVLGLKRIDPPADYYRHPKYHIDLHWSMLQYLKLSMMAFDLASKDSFNTFMLFIILLAGAMAGVQTYLPNDSTVDAIDILILSFFTFEIAVKLCMEGLRPNRYFTGSDWKWNWFDFLVVFFRFV